MNALIEHLGPTFEQLPPLLQRAHRGDIRLQGPVEVVRGTGLARLLGNALKMPAPGSAVPLVVEGRHDAAGMRWQRDFAGRQLVSHFRPQGAYLLEQMGPIKLWMHLRVEQGRLTYNLDHASIWGLPIPKGLAPRLLAFEAQEQDRYRFQVEVSLPLLGLLIRYGGSLQLEAMD
ncbi:MAG: DUF4166 domain-containing protein [Pseudomonadota bacterium]